MTHEFKAIDSDIKLNRHGEVDVDYYYRNAKALQAQALSELTRSTRKAIGNRLYTFYEKYLCRNCPVTH